MANQEKAWEISKAAFDAEFDGKFDEALGLHGEAVKLLESLTHDVTLLQTEPVRLAKRQLQVHEGRLQTLHAAKSSGSAVTPLSTVRSFSREMANYVQRGKKDIGTVNCLLHN